MSQRAGRSRSQKANRLFHYFFETQLLLTVGRKAFAPWPPGINLLDENEVGELSKKKKKKKPNVADFHLLRIRPRMDCGVTAIPGCPEKTLKHLEKFVRECLHESGTKEVSALLKYWCSDAERVTRTAGVNKTTVAKDLGMIITHFFVHQYMQLINYSGI